MKQKTTEILISAAGIAALSAIFALWCCNAQYSMAGTTAAVISAVLFAAVCLRFVPVWVSAWRNGEQARSLELFEPEHICAKIFAGIFAWDIAIILAVYCIRFAAGNAESFLQSLDFWRCTDSQHYLAIAQDWYLSEGDMDRLVQLVFLPGYPIAVRLVNLAIGNYLYSGLIVSALCFAGAGCVLYRLMRLDVEHGAAVRAVKFLCISPAVFFFAAPMSESLFVLCSLACLYLVRKEKYALGCIIGALAAFTRSLGIILVVPVLFELAQSREKAVKYLNLLIIPLGFAAYCLINYLVAGDAFKFMEYQHDHWNQQLGWFFNTAAYQTENALYCFAEKRQNFLGLWLPNILAQLFSLVIMLFAVKKLRVSYCAHFLAYYVVAIGATWLLSAPRYLAAMVSMPAAMSCVTEKRSADIALTVFSCIFGAAYLLAFIMHWQVW